MPESRSTKPTSLTNGMSNMPARTASKRRHEKLSCAAKIHGATEQTLTPAFDGMFETLQKRCKLETLTGYVLSNKKLTKSVVAKSYKKFLKSLIRISRGVLQPFTPVVSWANANIRVSDLCFQ